MSLYQKFERNSFNRTANIETEQKIAEDLLRRKNFSDGKVADNMLRISIFLNFSLIFLNIFLIIVSTRVFSSQFVGEGDNKSLLGISFRALTIDYKYTKEHINFNLFCIQDDKCASDGCGIKNDIDFFELSKSYNIECSQFLRFKHSALYYIVVTGLGNLLTLSNNITLILLVFGKVKLLTAENINLITRWDTLFYFAGIIGYILGINVLFAGNLYIGRESFILVIILVLSSTNFYCIKTNISQRIRIMARGKYLDNNLI